ncbi:class I SAM-dependent methyltransferase [Patescibacteria group bacterium]|nr:class I SAM-dependent methyltransferase [Patescibacteria group bacterium]
MLKSSIAKVPSDKEVKESERGYDLWHKSLGFSEESEYYEMLGTLIKGCKSVDIGCGSGFIEIFSPDTVGVDFSKEALKIAKGNGVKHLVEASADNLPFKENEFEVSLSNGVLEHCINQEKTVAEMVRVSKIQIIIAHARLPYGLELIRKPFIGLFGLKDQPVEKPLSLNQIEKMLLKNGSRVLVRGIWNYVDLRWIWEKIPYGIVKIPSHHFVIAIKTKQLKRRLLGRD